MLMVLIASFLYYVVGMKNLIQKEVGLALLVPSLE